MATIIEKILAKKNAAAKSAANAVALAPPSPAPRTSSTVPAPCPSCGSAIRWLNAAGVACCPGCQPPKVAALIRSREILATDQATGISRWERLVELPDGRLASASVLATLTAADGDGGGMGDEDGQDGRRFVEIDPDAYFKPAEVFSDYLANDRKWFSKPSSAKLRGERQENSPAQKQKMIQ